MAKGKNGQASCEYRAQDGPSAGYGVNAPGIEVALCPQELLDALSNNRRRRIMLLARDAPTSPSKVSRALGITVKSATQHFKLLRKVGLLEETETAKVRGATEHFHVPTAVALGNPLVVAILNAFA